MTPRRIRFVVAAVFLAAALARLAPADEETDAALSARLAASQSRVAVAEPVSVTLTATAPEGWDIQLPEIPARFGELRVTSIEAPAVQRRRGSWTRSVRFQVEAFLPGRHRIEPLTVRFSDDVEPSSDAGVARIERTTQPVHIRVRSSQGLFSGSQLREIDGPVWVPWSWREWTIATAAIAAAGLCAYGVLTAIQRWRASRPLTQRRLLRELERLDQARLDRGLSNDDLAVAAAKLLRTSLQLRDRPNRVHRTTDEWLEYMAEDVGLNQFTEPASQVFHSADAVKFSGRTLSAHEARSSLEAAHAILRHQLEGSSSGGPQR